MHLEDLFMQLTKVEQKQFVKEPIVLIYNECRAPQAGGSCCVGREAVEEVAGPLLKPLGVEGAPFSAVGE